jgi:hypothetical protein
VCQEIVKAAMHENVAIKIDAPALQKLLKADHIGPMRRVQQWIAEHLTRRFNFDDLNNIFRQVPPGAFRLKLAVQECLIRLDALYSASNACIMDQTKGLASEIGRQAVAEMKDFRDHIVERIELPPS